MKRRFAFRQVRCLISAVLLGGGAVAFDSRATPELIGDHPWSPGAARSEDLPPDGVRHRGKRQPVIELAAGSPLELGEIPLETGAVMLTRVDVYDNDTSNFLHLAGGVNPSLTGPRVAAGKDRDEPADAPFREAAEGGIGAGAGSRSYPWQIWNLRELRQETGELVTHPLTILAVLIVVGAWLAAKLMDRVDRLRTTRSRTPGRSRYRGHRHRSRRDRPAGHDRRS